MNLREYRAPSWLKGGGHVESIYPKLLKLPLPLLRRELWADSSGTARFAVDFADSDHPDAPIVVLLHGLEGSSDSHYAQALMQRVRERGWHGAVLHYRGCGGVENLSDKAYHSGDSTECAWMLHQVRQRFSRQPLFAVGVSLGGNILAKYLGETAAAALPQAAAVVSAPLDLTAASPALEHGLARLLYAPYFLRSLLPKVRAQAAQGARLPNTIDLQLVLQSRTLKAFDNSYTAPLHGFADADDYYRRASAKPLLGNIGKPTLLINAQNDPFMPAAALPKTDEVSGSVTLMQPPHGGHVGFVSGRFPGHLNWLPDTVLDFFAAHLP